MPGMDDGNRPISIPVLLLGLCLLFGLTCSQSFVGINYGEVADNLPPPEATAKLLQSTTITKLRLYSVNPSMLQALASTGISVIITASSTDIPPLAVNPSFSASWLANNVLPFHPATTISTISVGNEVFLSNDSNLISQLLPAMQNLHNALVARSLDTQIKISTVHPMSILVQSDPPSSGLFDPARVDTIKSIVAFLQQIGGSFMINPYPYFAYQTDPTPDTLAFCLFQPNKGRLDRGTKVTYTNMFDAQVDAVKWALKGIGFGDVEIVVAETGWPYRGDSGEAGASVENAKAYNANLMGHLRSMVGTPMMPGKSVDTYLFALYDEDLKPGPLSERSFGIYRTDMTMIYDVGLSKSTISPPLTSPSPPLAKETSYPPPTAQVISAPPRPVQATSGLPPPVHVTSGSSSLLLRTRWVWCLPKAGISKSMLQANVDYDCRRPATDSHQIQPGASLLPTHELLEPTMKLEILADCHPYNQEKSKFVLPITVTTTTTLALLLALSFP